MKKVLLLILSLFVSPAFASGINANTNSAPCTNNTLETYSGNTNLQADWQPNTINLRWYNENEKLTVEQSAQTCTYDGTLTVPQTPPTRTGYTFAGWEVKYTIPAGYTELQYIESTGTQYIDTGYFYNINANTIQYFVDLSLGSENATGITNRKIIGVYDSAHSRPMSVSLYTDNEVRVSAGDLQFLSGKIKTTYLDNVRFDIKTTINHNDKTISLKTRNTTITTTYTGSIPSSNNVYLFTYNDYYTPPDYRKIYAKMYRAAIYENGILVRNFIPAKRNSDNVVGMWDTVTQTFFTNAGTGTFIAGPAVQ